MNKKIKFLIAMAAVAGIATPALAIEADIKGFYQARGVMHDNIKTDEKTVSGVDQRFRLWTTGAVNENVKAVLGFEIDNAWGTSSKLDSDGNTVPTTKGGDTGTADQVGNIEVKHAYLDFKVPSIETRFVAGLQGFDVGRSFIFSEDAAGLKVIKDMPWGGKLAFNWIKEAEGFVDSASDDVDFYSIQADFAAGGFSVAPIYGFYNHEDGADVHYYGVSADGKAGDIGLALTLIGNNWDDGTNNADNDGSGLIAFGKVSVPVGATTVSAEAAYMGDKDTADGSFVDVRNASFINFSEILQGGAFDARGSNIGTSVEGQSKLNHVYAKVTAKHKYSDKVSIEASVMHLEQAEDVGATKSITYGQEIDAYYTHNIDKGLSVTLGGGYLFADSDFKKEDPWKVGTALTYKF